MTPTTNNIFYTYSGMQCRIINIMEDGTLLMQALHGGDQWRVQPFSGDAGNLPLSINFMHGVTKYTLLHDLIATTIEHTQVELVQKKREAITRLVEQVMIDTLPPEAIAAVVEKLVGSADQFVEVLTPFSTLPRE